MNNLTYNIGALPEFDKMPHHTKAISRYFEKLLDNEGHCCEQCAFLPSMFELSKFLGSSMVDIYVALQDLKKKGYDFFVFGVDCPITLWPPNNKEKLPHQAFNFG